MDQLANKKSVWVFRTTAECPLNHYDLLVYSYMAFQARYGRTPSLRNVHHSTGMSKNTAQAVCKRLNCHGLLDDNLVVRNIAKDRLGWFLLSEDLRERCQHFSGWITNWRCYIRQPGIDLTLDGISVYSFVRHCAISKYRPRQGMTAAYIGTVLGISPKTVAEVLIKLEDHDLIRTEAKNIKVFRLTETQLTWFKDKAEFAEDQGGDCEYVDELPPERKSKEQEIREMFDVIGNALKFKSEERDDLNALVKQIFKLNDWRSRWQGLVAEIPSEAAIEERRAAFSELLDRETPVTIDAQAGE
ncbi:MAG: hypothetical protein ACYC0X_23615 [Pirellulaceae bacterium]